MYSVQTALKEVICKIIFGCSSIVQNSELIEKDRNLVLAIELVKAKSEYLPSGACQNISVKY